MVVVGLDELVEKGLEFGDGGRLDGLGGEPVLHCLLEAFDFAAGGRVVRAGVLLDDVEAWELGFQAVASAAAPGEPCGVDEAVVGEH